MADLDALLNGTLWTRAVYAFLGFVVPVIVRNLVESGSTDLPDEGYGAIALVLENMILDGTDRTYMMVGSGLYVVDALAARFGVRETIRNIGSSVS